MLHCIRYTKLVLILVNLVMEEGKKIANMGVVRVGSHNVVEIRLIVCRSQRVV